MESYRFNFGLKSNILTVINDHLPKDITIQSILADKNIVEDIIACGNIFIILCIPSLFGDRIYKIILPL